MKAVVIYKTDDQIDCNRTDIREQIEEFFDDPNNYAVKEFADENGLLHLIHETLGSTTRGVTVSNILETRDTVYVGFFIDIAETIDYNSLGETEEEISKKLQEEYKKVKLNIFGSQITSQQVTSNLLIVKQNLLYDITDNNIKTTMSPTTTTKREVMDVCEKIFVKEGLVIEVDGSISSYTYILNPIEHLILSDPEHKDHYIYHEYEVYTHVMMIVTDVREINGQRNVTASLLSGKPANGRVFVAMYRKPDYNENPPYVSLNTDLLKKILSIRSRSTHLTTGMNRTEREYINFEKILELECKKHKDEPVIHIDDIQGESLNQR